MQAGPIRPSKVLCGNIGIAILHKVRMRLTIAIGLDIFYALSFGYEPMFPSKRQGAIKSGLGRIIITYKDKVHQR